MEHAHTVFRDLPMTRRLLITGTDSGVGKTLLGCAVAFAARARGMRVGVMKPAETGCARAGGDLTPGDALALVSAASSRLPLELVCPYRYRLPLAPPRAAEADGLPSPDPATIERSFHAIADQSDFTIVEGAGGISTPISWDFNSAELALRLDLDVVLVVGNRPGCLNAAVLSVHYARARGLKLVGCVLSDTESVDESALEASPDSLSRLVDVPCLGRIRHKEPVSLAIIGALLGKPTAQH